MNQSRYSSFQYFFLILTTLGILFMSCSKDDTTDIRGISLSADKNLAILGFDTINLRTVVRDNALEEIQGLDIDYFVNDNPISDTIYIPTTTGSLKFKATYQQITSNIVSVEVKSVEEDVEELVLLYNGNKYLTDNPWSIGGSFSYGAKIGSQIFPFNNGNVQLSLNGSPISNPECIQFDTPGTYNYQAEFGNLQSESISIVVREDIEFPLITIPIIFHDYGTGMTSTQANQLLNELNDAYNAEVYSKEIVEAGRANPNAVDCHMRFSLHPTDRDGNLLTETGIEVIKEPIPDSTLLLTKNEFKMFESMRNIDPNVAINFWVTEDWDFGFSKLDPDQTAGSGNARGSAYAPLVNGAPAYPGIIDLTTTRIDLDPDTISQSIIFRSGSILGEHPDFVVNRVAYFLGVYDNGSFNCRNDGDYCKDTYDADFSNSTGMTDLFFSCDGTIFSPSNHMSFLNMKNNFTYDQRERMRFILEYGLNRPSL